MRKPVHIGFLLIWFIMALTPEEQHELLLLLEQKEEHKRYNLRDYIFPESGQLSRHNYPKHMEFFRASAKYSVVMFLAGNRCGKSYSASYRLACDAEGVYPDWWEGARAKGPGLYWAGSFTHEKIKEGIQTALCGEPSNLGTGLLHKERIKETRSKPNTAGAFSYVEVWYGKDLEFAKKNNLFSTIVFKTYDNYEGWTAAAVDGVVLDEVPPPTVYIEAKQRTITTKGYLNLTFTPDKGMNDTTQLFFPDGEYTSGAKSDNKYIVFASVYDAPHLTPEMISKMMEDMPDYLQQAKLHGIPYLGQGAVFPIMKDSILADPFPIPNSWERAFGMDTGWVATAALFGARDPNTGTIYVYAEYKEGQMPPDTHARRIKAIRDSSGLFEDMVGCVDCHSQNSHSTGANDYSLYSNLGLSIFPSDGKAGTVESSILKVYDLLDAGKIKIFKNLTKTLAEYNMYRRGDDGKPVKGNTINNGMHLMDCFRYLITAAMPYARPVPEHDYRNNLVRIQLDTYNKVTGY